MSPEPVKVLFFDHTAAWSGGEVALYHLVTNLDPRRFSPVVVLGEEGPLADRLREAAVEVQVLPMRDGIKKARKDGLGWRSLLRFGRVFGALAYCWKLRRLIRSIRPAIVFTNSLKADFLGGIAARLSGVRLIWSVQDRIEDDYLPKAMVRLFRMLARWMPHAIITNSRATLETLHLPPARSSRAHVIHCGVEIPASVVETFWGPGLTAGIIGRLAPWKGQEIFLRAVAELGNEFPSARFQIIGAALFGETSYADELRLLVGELKLQERVEFLGFRSDVPELLRKLDVVVHASTCPEPFGLVVAEAMAAGRAVIATRGGGIAEMVQDGVTGRLVTMGSVNELAQAMRELLQSRDSRVKMGAEARRFASTFLTVKRQAGETMDVFSTLCGEMAPARQGVAATGSSF